jgi:hypothetical protein
VNLVSNEELNMSKNFKLPCMASRFKNFFLLNMFHIVGVGGFFFFIYIYIYIYEWFTV